MAFLDFLSPIFGSKPEIANYTPVDLSDEQLKAITANISNFPQFAELGNLYQNFMLNQYEHAIPGFKDILAMGGATTKQMLGTAQEELAGKIPQDVQDAVQRSSAFQNLLAGGGGGMAQANTARNFGLTSLDLIGQGANLAGQAGNAAQRWASLAAAGGPAGMMVTPEQQSALDVQQNLIKRNVQQQKYNVAAAPDPVAKGLSDIVMYLTGQYLGSVGGGGGMGGGGGSMPTAGNAPATAAAGSLSSDLGGFGSTGATVSGGSGTNWGGIPAPTSGAGASSGSGFYGGYGGVSPNYYGIGANPFTTSDPFALTTTGTSAFGFGGG